MSPSGFLSDSKQKGCTLILFGLLLSLFTACIPARMPDATSAPSLTPVVVATQENQEKATALPIEISTEPALLVNTPEAQQQPPPLTRTLYQLAASMDYQAHLISIEQSIDYLNLTSSTLDSLVLVLEPQHKADGFTLRSVQWGDGSAVENYTLADGRLHLPLIQPLLPGNTLSVKMAYAYYLPNRLAPFGFSERQINLADWYAFIPPYLPEEGWMLREPASVGENLVYDLADYQVEIRLIGSTTGLRLAAPAPVEIVGDVYRFSRQMARNFVWSVGEYALLEGGQGQTKIQLYAFPEHVASGEMALRCVSEAMEVYSVLFGDPSLPQMIVVETAFPDGMEYDGLFFLNHLYFEYPGSGPRSGLCSLSVHEIAHQWWYRLVGNDPAFEPWLDEALCTYSELLFYESRYPELVPWWWDYRVDKHDPKGWVNDTIYEYSEYRPYVNAVYLQGVRFLDALRSQVGDAVMFDFLHEYARTYRYQQVNSEDFFNLLESISENKFQSVLDRYFSP